MKEVFADTSFFIAFLSNDDEHYEQALNLMQIFRGRITTTMWILAELGNYFSKSKTRLRFVPFVRDLSVDRRVLILPIDQAHFGSALEIYENRSDKEWSITDCTSFLIMKARGIREAWTTDHHFEQAGFVKLLT